MDELEKIRKKKIKELLSKARKEESKISVKPVVLTPANFKEILNKNSDVVVDFWAEWCHPCKLIAPIIEELAKEFAGKVTFAKFNVDDGPEIAMIYGISAIPTLMYFKNGKPIDQITGALPKNLLKIWIKRNLKGT